MRDHDTGNITAEGNTIALDLLLEKIFREGGPDLRNYKPGTVTRRLERRLYATRTKTYLEYMQFLDTHPEEYQRLADYLTIVVSGFFRSGYAFQQLARIALPELVSSKRKRGEHRLRFWSTACARGEEPYSIAIMLASFLESQLADFDILIYATDINQRALTQARAGIYSPRDVEGVPDNVLQNYFTHSDKGYAVNRDIRKMVKFSYFDLTSTTTSPTNNLDVIFCCNVLIYLQKQLQARVLDMLYSSLSPSGYLILGEAETPTHNLQEKLTCLDTKAKIYRKNEKDA